MTEADDGIDLLFAGARRAAGYTEPAPESSVVPRSVTPGDQDRVMAKRVSVAATLPDPYARLAGSASPVGPTAAPHPRGAGTSASAPPATSPPPREAAPRSPRWRGRGKTLPEPVVDPTEAASAFIRGAAWTRSVNVLVTNPKGGVGKTPTAKLLGDVLAEARGAHVAVWEAGEAAGTLTGRAEGNPVRGLGELLGAIGTVTGIGQLSGYTAAQSSHATVLGSVTMRGPLRRDDVLAVRRLLDTFNTITVTDTGNQLVHESYRAVLATSDAVVVPCLPSLDALAGAEQVLDIIANPAWGAPPGLRHRTLIVLADDGAPADPDIDAHVRGRLAQLDVPVLEVPYDPAIRRGGPLALAGLSAASRTAWYVVAATAVEALVRAPTDIDLVNQTQTNATPGTPTRPVSPAHPTFPTREA